MKLLLLIVTIGIAFNPYGNTNTKTRMVFPDFTEGTVVFKNRTKTTAILNYDTYEEQMIFKNGSEILALANPELILQVEINGKVFEWLEEDVFLEIIDSASVTVYKRNRNKLTSKGKGMPYGGVSNSSSVATVSNVPLGRERQAKDLNIDEKFELIPDNLFYIKHGTEFKSLITPKQISKIYGTDKKELEKFINSNKLDLQSTSDIIEIIQHYTTKN